MILKCRCISGLFSVLTKGDCLNYYITFAKFYE